MDTLSTSMQSSVQKQVLWIVSALGTSCWPLSLIPFLFGGGELELFHSLLLQHVFLNISIPPFFSFSQAVFQVGWQSAVHSYRLSRKFVSSVQKHVLTVCATSGGVFTPKAILLLQHDTILLTGSICTTCTSITYFAIKAIEKKRSFVLIVSKILLRAAYLAQPKDRTGAIFSHPIQKQKVTLWQL